MSDEPRSKSHASGTVLAVAGAMVLYVLSIGPVEYIASKGIMSSELNHLVSEFYRPVFWLAAKTSLKELLQNYLLQCFSGGGDPFAPNVFFQPHEQWWEDAQ